MGRLEQYEYVQTTVKKQIIVNIIFIQEIRISCEAQKHSV